MCSESTVDAERQSRARTLRNGLLAWVLLQPRISYVQGMNDLLARFLRVFPGDPVSFEQSSRVLITLVRYNCAQALAFWCFHNYTVNVQEDFLSDGMLRRIRQ